MDDFSDASRGLRGGSFQKRIDCPEQNGLLGRLQRFDALQPAQHFTAGDFRIARAGRLQQIVGGDFESGCQTENHVGIETELAAFVVGNQGLYQACLFGKLDLDAIFNSVRSRIPFWID